MNENKRYICIHGHFYQPPRENAWLERIDLQDSAHPFHDWNERINFECYAPNAVARILDDQDYIEEIRNNYKRISFNIGPTLLAWIEQNDSETYQHIVAADKRSQELFGGFGSASAQCYNHMIMPLANDRDRETQVIWGIADFQRRFGRAPEGMWLPETAADTASLEALVAQGIKFTIMAPRQAAAIRHIDSKDWMTLNDQQVDPRRPYICHLPSGKSITIYFYDGPVSQDIAFGGLLNNGKAMAARLKSVFTNAKEPQLVHIATDGESYGHHHRFGEMALASCLREIDNDPTTQLTNYAQFLAMYPPQYEVRIHEDSSWSCVHGVERWRSNCGCNTGGRPTWNQNWRAPLRETLDWLRDLLIPVFEREGRNYFKDPWAARNDYIQVILARDEKSRNAFIEKHVYRPLNADEIVTMLRLMEMQRQAMLMYTSCAWFFDEVSGIETMQVLQYACRAIQYAQQVAGIDLQQEFIERLKKIPSNVYENAAIPYEDFLLPNVIGMNRIGMHYAVAAIFEENPQNLPLFNYQSKAHKFHKWRAGSQVLAMGQVEMESNITLSKKAFSFVSLYLGQQNVIGKISEDMDDVAYDESVRVLQAAFDSTNLATLLNEMSKYYGEHQFTIWQLFNDQKIEFFNEITSQSVEEAGKAFKRIYDDNYQLMTALHRTGTPVPFAFKSAAQYVVNQEITNFFANAELDPNKLGELLKESQKWSILISDESKFAYQAGQRIYKEVKQVADSDYKLEQLNGLIAVLKAIKKLKIKPNLWQAQNAFFQVVKKYGKGEWVFTNPAWEKSVKELANQLEIKMTTR